ncbi:hypothetical protein [Streptomyces sp. enrichment culture]|uniref:hypothetical protein n=1 Tax=Streptomyces sp. enrichment culture TaxID=1795815 RepID=UPI003F55D464
MSTVVFRVKPATEQEKKQAAYKLRHVIRPRGQGEVTFVGRGTPAGFEQNEFRPRFTLYRDLEGRQPLCVVARPVSGQSSGSQLVVLDPHGTHLGSLRPPTQRERWRPRHEIELPGGERLLGRSGTITSWVVFVLLSPLWLLFNLLWAAGGTGDTGWSLPVRTAWRRSRSNAPGLSPLKYYGLTERYKVRTGRLDVRVAHAQAVLHHSSD